MGFSYAINYFTNRQHLACDFCYNSTIDYSENPAKWVKKINCSFGYCQAWACCDKCFKEKRHHFCSLLVTDSNGKIIKDAKHKDYCKKRMIELNSS